VVEEGNCAGGTGSRVRVFTGGRASSVDWNGATRSGCGSWKSSSVFKAENASIMRTTFSCGLMRPAYSRENRQLKHIVAEQAVDIRALKAVVAKKVVIPQMRREAVLVMQVEVRLRPVSYTHLTQPTKCSV